MDSGTPTAPFTEAVDANVQTAIRSKISKSVFRFWFVLRWKLASTVFSRSLPFVTANLELKLGDLLITLPLVLGLCIGSSIACAKFEVKGSGHPPTLTMALSFALAVRNNSILLTATGLPFDRALLYHKLLGVLTMVLAGVHGAAYLLSISGKLPTLRRRLYDDGGDSKSSTAQSGYILFGLLCALWVFSLNPIRRRFFEFFLRMHWVLFIAIFVLCVIHGAGAVVVGFVPWIIDMLYRLVYRARVLKSGSVCGVKNRLGVLAQSQISICKLPGDIIRIQFPRVRTDTGEGFRYEAGQYLFLCVPKISLLEWHPFTISSAPHEPLVTLHIKVLGDWTKKLQQSIPDAADKTTTTTPFPVLVDGAYGHASIDILSHETYAHIALFSGGIGVTPMQSIANQLFYDYHVDSRKSLKRVWFVWTVRDRDTLLAMLDEEFCRTRDLQRPVAFMPDSLMSKDWSNDNSVFRTEFFLTKGEADLENPLDHKLQNVLRYGKRPDIEQTLRNIGEEAKTAGRKSVGVLVCGPSALIHDVITHSLKVSRDMHLRFDVHSETFDF